MAAGPTKDASNAWGEKEARLRLQLRVRMRWFSFIAGRPTAAGESSVAFVVGWRGLHQRANCRTSQMRYAIEGEGQACLLSGISSLR